MMSSRLRARIQSPRWLKRLGSSLIIGGQAVTATAKGRINTVDLLDQLQEAGPGSFLIVIITALAAGTVFNIQVAKPPLEEALLRDGLTGPTLAVWILGACAIGAATFVVACRALGVDELADLWAALRRKKA